MKPVMSRVALGTAQLGMTYGIANATGKPEEAAALEIVAECWQTGVRYFDTAQAYGDSEVVLGRALRHAGVSGEARVISKLSPALQVESVESILNSLHVSLDRLGLQRLWGVLLHREEQLDHWNDNVGEALNLAHRHGLVDHVGVSVYSPQRALQALESPGLDLLQVPANLFDRRMKRTQVFANACTKAVTVFIRSIYLQGLALFSAEHAKATAPFALSAVTALEEFCRENGIDQKRFAFDYARNISSEAIRIVGAEAKAQVIENSRLENEPSLDPELFRQWDRVWPNDKEDLVNPSCWTKISRLNQ
jgi:aryl-alcohol dehydrogenase-like predicted oxidoreductase